MGDPENKTPAFRVSRNGRVTRNKKAVEEKHIMLIRTDKQTAEIIEAIADRFNADVIYNGEE